MIRAVLKDGVVQPLEPIPAEWSDGRKLWVQDSVLTTGAEPTLEEWDQSLQAIGSARYEPGERERIQAVLAEADVQAKEFVRRELELP